MFTGILNGIYASTPLERRTPIKIGIAEPYLPKPRPPAPAEGAEGATGVDEAKPDATGGATPNARDESHGEVTPD